MATNKLPLVDYEDDSDYASAEDDDFKPDDAPTAGASASEASDSEDETPEATEIERKKSVKRKRVKKDDEEEAEDVGFENSGDEAIIGKGLKKAKRRKRKGDEEEDEGGEGGFVKTRRMAAMAYVTTPIPFFCVKDVLGAQRLTRAQRRRKGTTGNYRFLDRRCRRSLGIHACRSNDKTCEHSSTPPNCRRRTCRIRGACITNRSSGSINTYKSTEPGRG